MKNDPNFFLQLFKNKIIFNFVRFVATKKVFFFHPSLLLLLLDPGSEIRDWVKIRIRDKHHPGSTTLLFHIFVGRWSFLPSRIRIANPDLETPIESGSITLLLLLSYFSELGCAHGGERRGPQRGGPRHQAEHWPSSTQSSISFFT
jgi:hypothetical protein